MALSVKIVKDPTGSPETFYLKVDHITEGVQRPVTTVSVFGNYIFQLDLGRREYSVSISGTANDTTDATNVADRYDLQTIAKTWYNYTIRLYLDANNYKVGKIKRLELTREPWMDYWKFRMDFIASDEVFV